KITDRKKDLIGCGATYLPPAVLIRSFFLSVIFRYPSASNSPMSPVWNQPSGFFFSSRRRHTRSVSAFLLNRSSDLPLIRLFLLVLILLLMPTLNFLPVWFAL